MDNASRAGVVVDLGMTHRFLLAVFLLAACGETDSEAPSDDSGSTDGGGDADGGEADEVEALVFEPATIDFGTVGSGCEASATVRIRNPGDAAVEIETVTVSDLRVRWSSDTLPGPLAAGAEGAVTLVFEPTDEGELDATLALELADASLPSLEVPLTGSATRLEAVTDSWLATGLDTVDLLVVVDDSVSMRDELAYYHDAFARLPELLIDSGVDFHLGVISMDMDDPDASGRLRGGVIRADDLDPTAAFLEAAQVPGNGDGYEFGFDAIIAALSEPLISTDNAGFLRVGVPLAVLVLSDEDAGEGITPAELAGFLEALDDDVRLDAIVGDPPVDPEDLSDFGGCDLPGSPKAEGATWGGQWIDAAERTGGEWRSICSGDPDSTVLWGGHLAMALQSHWPLSREPFSWGALDVSVDGETVAFDANLGWTYDAEDNAVELHGAAVPLQGQTLEVRYDADIACD